MKATTHRDHGAPAGAVARDVVAPVGPVACDTSVTREGLVACAGTDAHDRAVAQNESVAPDGPTAPAGSVARLLVDRLEHSTTTVRRLAAERYAIIDQLRQVAETETGASWRDPDDLAWRDLRAEIAAVTHVHEKAAQAQLELARRLVHDFTATLNGMRDGAVSERHAHILVRESAGLSPENLADYEARLLPSAGLLIPTRFEKLAQQIRASLEPEALIERHREALSERRVFVEAAPDGMAWIGALLSAEDAIGASAAVTGIARGLMIEGETRTRSQVEADVFRDFLTDATGLTPPPAGATEPVASPGARRGVRAEVLIHVPVMTAMGLGDDAGLLDGYGPIDADTARALCADAPGFIRILTDPEDGATLSFGRSSYRVPAELKRYLRVRDEVCRFVGCTRSAALCDIDHTTPWAEDGETVESNLAHLCRGHHRLKERGRWNIRHDPGGILRWTSPTGRTYETRPAQRALGRKPPTRVGAPPRPMAEWLLSNTPPESDQPAF
jgi:hypothetical protein